MSKRRARVSSTEEGSEDEKPAGRRDRRGRRRDRTTRGSSAAAKGMIAGRSPLRRVLLLGIPAGAIVTAVVVLVFFNPFTAPCVAFQSIPGQGNVPAFPAHSTTDFLGTWCPNATKSETIHIEILIAISGHIVGLPPSIGRNSSYTLSGRPYECDLPITTHPANASYPSGIVTIASPWDYAYTLANFFGVWQQSYSGAYVNSTHPSQPITYNQSELLGYVADSSHEVDLFVDGQRSSAGPSLELNTLPHVSDANPSCINTVWGSNHVIALAYGPRGATVAPSLASPPTLLSAPSANPYVPSGGIAGSSPALHLATDRAPGGTGNLQWLSVRVALPCALPGGFA